jgi:hypothetical protein
MSAAADDDTTRRSILSAIRDQARLLRQQRASDTAAAATGTADADANDATSTKPPPPQPWQPEQWWESFQFLFVAGAHAHAHQHHRDHHHHDDLLFFVRRRDRAQQPFASWPRRNDPADAGANGPLLVRRRRADALLPEDLRLSGARFGEVDWPATVLLNLALQARYTLTVVACGAAALPFVASSSSSASAPPPQAAPAGSVRALSERRVYPSTTATPVNVAASGRPQAPEPCYPPDVCFAVDEFLLDEEEAQQQQRAADDDEEEEEDGGCGGEKDSEWVRVKSRPGQRGAFGELVLGDNGAESAAAAGAEAADCYCVVLRASLRLEGGGGGGDGGASAASEGERVLFAGFVRHGQVVEFMNSTRGRGAGGQGGNGGAGGQGGGGGGPNLRSLFDALFGRGGGSGGGDEDTGLDRRRAAAAPPPLQREQVTMTGPGGTGRCEVAVTRLPAAAPAAPAAAEPSSLPPLRFSLMQLRLPVAHLAQELLESVVEGG